MQNNRFCTLSVTLLLSCSNSKLEAVKSETLLLWDPLLCVVMKRVVVLVCISRLSSIHAHMQNTATYCMSQKARTDRNFYSQMTQTW